MQQPFSPRIANDHASTSRAAGRGPLGGLTALGLSLALGACGDGVPFNGNSGGTPGSLTAEGRELFRNGTLGAEGFWSEVAGLDSGLAQAEFSTLDALELGLQLDSEAMDTTTLNELLDELDGSLSGGSVEMLDDPLVFEALLSGGAVVGLVGVDQDGVPGIALDGPDSIGISCAFCHSVVDGSAFSNSTLAGMIGQRVDGPAPSALRVGAFFALAERSSALYPYLTQSHATIGGNLIGRTDAFVEADSTEAEFDALLMDAVNFPAGQWDVTPDGIGNATVVPHVFDIRAAAPYGVAGEFENLVDAINAHATLCLDPTTLLTTPGSVFMNQIGLGIGTEIVNEYDDVFADTGAMVPAGGLPYIDAAATGFSGVAQSPVGFALATQELNALAAYLLTLDAPSRPLGDIAARARGEAAFAQSCAGCHGELDGFADSPAISLLDLVVPYAPTMLLGRGFPFSDVLDDRLRTYDDRLVIFDRLFSPVQVPAQARDYIAPNLRGLDLRDAFLHDGSVPSLDLLLDPVRGPGAPHAYFIEADVRGDLVEFLTTR